MAGRVGDQPTSSAAVSPSPEPAEAQQASVNAAAVSDAESHDHAAIKSSSPEQEISAVPAQASRFSDTATCSPDKLHTARPSTACGRSTTHSSLLAGQPSVLGGGRSARAQAAPAAEADAANAVEDGALDGPQVSHSRQDQQRMHTSVLQQALALP